LTVAVVGEPNVGKSSLINALARREVAIVSEIAGTTRDVIEVALDLAGVPVTLIDTAGLRETADPIEAEGIRRARARAEAADLVLHVAETMPSEPHGQVVINKVDRDPASPDGLHGSCLFVSARTGAGIDALIDWLVDWASGIIRTHETPLVTRERQRRALDRAGVHLDEALAETDAVLRAEALRLAARALGRVTGRVDVEEVLGEIFGRFCIGK
jgi:tRNA modification GTPase